jgi:radical SAM protein with 4Fe4S-binding SPASM domain
VIRRDPIEETFDDELEAGTLRPPFVALVNAAIAKVRAAHPLLIVESSTPELESERAITVNPAYHPGPLPPGAIIHSCDQDPWETVHVLANGDVVVCEQRDQVVLGNLRSHTLAQIWRSPDYMKFRSDYVAARDKHCIACPYKKAALPARLPTRFEAPDIGRTSLMDGWFADDGGDIAWSRCRAFLELSGRGRGSLLLRGYLPAVRRGRNKLEIRVDGASFATVSNRDTPLLEFRIERPFVADGKVRVEFDTALEYCPAEQSGSEDSRKLGFALVEAAFSSI